MLRFIRASDDAPPKIAVADGISRRHGGVLGTRRHGGVLGIVFN